MDINFNKILKVKHQRIKKEHKKVCPNNYKLVDNDRCINTNKTKEKVSGLVCEGEKTKLQNNKCISYEIIEAKHN